MHILYVDESGDYSNWEENKNFVMAGVAVHEGQIDKISRVLDQIQHEFFPGFNINISFHATDIKNGKKAFKDLSSKVREEMLSKLYGVFANFR